MRHILTLFDGRVVVLAVVLLALAALVAVVVGRRTDTVWQLFLALCGSALIATMTIGNRGIVVSDMGFADDFTWWTRNWGTLPSLIEQRHRLVAERRAVCPSSGWLDAVHDAPLSRWQQFSCWSSSRSKRCRPQSCRVPVIRPISSPMRLVSLWESELRSPGRNAPKQQRGNRREDGVVAGPLVGAARVFPMWPRYRAPARAPTCRSRTVS